VKNKSVFDNPILSCLILVILLTVVVALWLWLPPYLMSEISEVSERGVYGDSFGSVNALFTGLAFAGLIFTILLQQRELKLQREELKSHMEEMQLSRDEISRQTDLLIKKNALDEAGIRMKPLEVRVAQIQIEAGKWEPVDRFKHTKSMFDEVTKEMNDILNGLDKNDG
jgi:hypothetical protein